MAEAAALILPPHGGGRLGMRRSPMSGTWPPLWGRASPARQALLAGHSQRRPSSYKDATIVLANPCKAMPRRVPSHAHKRSCGASAADIYQEAARRASDMSSQQQHRHGAVAETYTNGSLHIGNFGPGLNCTRHREGCQALSRNPYLVGCDTTKSASCEGRPLAAPPQMSIVQPSPVAAGEGTPSGSATGRDHEPQTRRRAQGCEAKQT